MSDIISNWKRIERWLGAHAPEALEQLEPPAKPEAIARVAATVGALPDDYLALLRIHDGVDDADDGIGVYEGFVPYSLEDALRVRQIMHDVTREGRRTSPDVHDAMRPDPGVRQRFWHDAWFPVAVWAGGARTMIFMDLDPAPGGTQGQLVKHVIDMDTLPIVARSISEWIDRVANTMESGRVSVEREPIGPDDDDGELVHLRWSRDGA